METTPELIIFFVVGAVAIVAAMMMLISENAVHSALFLVLNFACVAFLYLMLQAAFLAMIQITVYAGAIMVLFMFVIMLLGAERMAPEETPRFRWLTPVAVILTTVFLITAGVGILEADISATEPEPYKPMLRVINTAGTLENVNVYLNDEPLAEDLGVYASSELQEWEDGDYTLSIETDEGESLPLSLLQLSIPAGDENAAEETEEPTVTVPPTLEVSEPVITLEANQDVTLVILSMADEAGGYGIIPVIEDFGTVDLSKTANIHLVHAVAGAEAFDFAEITQADREPEVIAESLPFGGVSEMVVRRRGDADYAVYPAGLIATTQATHSEDFKASLVQPTAKVDNLEFQSNTSTLLVVTEPLRRGLLGQQPGLQAFTVDNRPSFGGPTSVGEKLFTTYMLPFQIIALLLLVAMIGAIVLTRDQVPPPRKRFPRRLASTGEPVTGETSQD
jgi:NADH-quinone oxidoreductase subunit J